MGLEGRKRATRHCRDCEYHVKELYKTAPNKCWKMSGRLIGHDRAKTSPDWCPLGHLIPGRSYPTFTAGSDPVIVQDDVERVKQNALF